MHSSARRPVSVGYLPVDAIAAANLSARLVVVMALLQGHIPVLLKPEAMFFGLNARCQAGQKAVQNILLDILIMPRLLNINSCNPCV